MARRRRSYFLLAGLLGPTVVRAVNVTTRVRFHPGPGRSPPESGSGRPVIFAFWHGRMLIPAWTHRRRGIRIMVSRHGDGEYISRIVERLGFHTIRGSTTTGGAVALRSMVSGGRAEHFDLAVTPDGPKGPRYRVQPGVIYLASRTGFPIVPCGIEPARAWRLRSWDEFTIPKPFTRIAIVYRPALEVPSDLREDGIEHWRALLEAEMARATEERGRAVGDVLVGPAGWSYEDWKGRVYPHPPPRGFDPLEFLARFFDVVEINSSFYRPPSATASRSWVRRVAANPRFLFTAKLYQGFTHAPTGRETGPAPPVPAAAFLEGIGPIVEAGRLGALLLQFPWSFRYGPPAREQVEELWNRFRDLPLVLEARHATWSAPEAEEFLRALGIGFCNIDQPRGHDALRPAARLTSSVGYVRLHGRNAANWFRRDAGAAERYDYLYDAAELEPWVERTRALAGEAGQVFVVLNNHFQGKGVANALMLRARLEGRRVAAPPGLARLYPALGELVEEEAG